MSGVEDDDTPPPQTTEEAVYRCLDAVLDIGIKEEEFWNMTIAEVNRAVRSYNRKMDVEQKQKAYFDYVLADLVGRSIARIQGSGNKMPDITKAYPTIFKDTEDIEKQKSQKKTELSALRFKQFADLHNRRYLEVAENKC